MWHIQISATKELCFSNHQFSIAASSWPCFSDMKETKQGVGWTLKWGIKFPKHFFFLFANRQMFDGQFKRSSRPKPQPTGCPKPLAYRRYHKSVSCLTHSLNSPWNRGSGTAATLGLKRRRPRRFKLTRVSVKSQGWFQEWGTFRVESRPLWAVWGDQRADLFIRTIPPSQH